MRTHLWDDDEDLRAEADAERQKAAQTRKPNGYDSRSERRHIRLIPFSKMVPDLFGLSLVGGVLAPRQISVVYGAPGSGKTFLALDIGLHVATGKDWFGRHVTSGDVVYVAAEAGTRIHNRVFAWRMDRQLMLATDKQVSIFSVPMQLDLCNGDGDLDELIKEIRAERVKPLLIIVDTISRVMAGGNENSPEDMGAIIASADRLRDEFGCHVSLVHHVGKDVSRGARGHSSLRAAADTEIEVTRDEKTKISTARVVKQRDGEDGQPIHFTLRVVKLGENEDTGEEVTSCVVEPADDDLVLRATAQVNKAKMPKAQRVALDALEHAIAEKGEEPPDNAKTPPGVRCVRIATWRQYCYDIGISEGEPRARQNAFKRAIDALVEQGHVSVFEPWVWAS